MGVSNTELMTFRSGNILFGLPITQVLTITGAQETLHCKAFTSKQTMGVSEYQGIPVSVVDLAKANNVVSTSETSKQLVETLKQRKKDHIDWFNALEDALVNDAEFTLDRDPDICAFGKWVDTYKTDDEELTTILALFDKPHTKIHQLADELFKIKEAGDIQQCITILNEQRKTTFKYLINLFERTCNHISTSIKTVFIYLTLDGQKPCVALCVDEITNVEVIVENGFTSMSDMSLETDETSLQYLSGYQKLQSGNDCLLIELELLLSNPSLNHTERKAS